MTNSSEQTRPTGVVHNREEKKLLISWNDGHESQFELDLLREICPCVECRGGHGKMGASHDPDVLTLTPTRSHEVRDLQLIGNYALQFWWDDNHNSGIYTWEYLRRMCTCELCNVERAEIG